MSAPICGWVFSVGRALKLPAPQRLVLWAMAERTNPKRDDGSLLCWSSFTQLTEDTGLSRPTILAVVRDLSERGLISVQKEGQRNIYRILQPVNIFTGNRSKSLPDRLKSEPVTGKKTTPQPVKKPVQTGKNIAHELTKELQKNPYGAGAPDAATARREPEKGFKSLEEGKATAPPTAPPVAANEDRPTTNTTSGGEPIPESLDTASFDAFLAERRSVRATVPLATARPEVLSGEVPPPDAPVGATATASVVRGVVHGFRNNPPPLVSALDRQELIDALRPPQRRGPIYASLEVLAAARADLARRAAARA
jgi:DNA-binding transcriptional ArsR family regulator